MRARPLSLVAVIVLLGLAGLPIPAAANPPLADAGLDQTVTKGATVHLDATGSRDPDGEITSYRWEIEDPNGGTISPDCATCGTTAFSADIVGRYAVTVEVTDADGDTATDTLYVDVEPGEPPSIELTGPGSLRTGQTATYVAAVTAGDAPLDAIVWFLDGTPTSTTDVSGTTATVSVDRQFSGTGTHRIVAKAVDEDGQTRTDSLETRVAARSVDDPGQRGTASIRGPRVITGDEPLTGSYSVSGTHVDTVTWWQDGRRVGTGGSISTSFDPGDHSLHARVTYTDGSDGIARFADGTTSVVADPRPSIDTRTLDGLGGVNASATATDAYGNLRRFELRLDDTTILTRRYSRLELRDEDSGRALSIDTRTTNVDPGHYTATLVATDGRGQTATVERTIHVRGPPEIVRSEFVNDEPVESYHPRIDANRYTATHVVEIALNGADPDDVWVERSRFNSLKRLDNAVCRPEKDHEDDRITYRSCWGNPGKEPSSIHSNLMWSHQPGSVSGTLNELSVRLSKPEIRARVISGGAGTRADEWGLVIDAGNSFDPDGGDLVFNWYNGAKSVNSNGSIGKLDSFQAGGLIVQDDEMATVEMTELFTRHYNPKVESIREDTSGPYLPNETVRFIVSTRPYELPKGRYRDDISLQLSPSVGRVTGHFVYNGEFSGEVRENPLHSELDNDSKNHDQQIWAVEVPAEAFLSGNPTFETYNIHNKKETLDRFEFDSPTVLKRGEPQLDRTEVTVTYIVEVPTFAFQETVYPSIRDELERNGFAIASSSDTGTEWTFERREKVSDAVYETSIQRFDESGTRSMFLDFHPEWTSSGSYLQKKEIVETDHVWRDSPSGKGEPTGDTRTVQTRPPEYRTERQYQYEYEVTETRTRYVTRTYTFRALTSYSDTVTQCNRYIGCYKKSVTRNKWVTKTGTRRIKKTYTVQETRTDSYWSTGRRHPSHRFTGQTRMKLVQQPIYETQYEYQIERTRTIRDRMYEASRTRLVEPAVYEWQTYKITRSPIVANNLDLRPDIRLASKEPVTKWILQKQTGTVEQTYTSYSNNSDVERTRVHIDGKVNTPYLDPDTGDSVRATNEELQEEFIIDRYITRDSAIEIYLESRDDGEE